MLDGSTKGSIPSNCMLMICLMHLASVHSNSLSLILLKVSINTSLIARGLPVQTVVMIEVVIVGDNERWRRSNGKVNIRLDSDRTRDSFVIFIRVKNKECNHREKERIDIPVVGLSLSSYFNAKDFTNCSRSRSADRRNLSLLLLPTS